MSDNFRWKYGDTKPVVTKAIGTAVVIELGDLVFQEANGDVKPASSFTWSSDLPTTQDAFANAFLGVAMQRSRSGDTDPIRVATAGVFEFPCASATFELGGLIGPAKATGNALEDQKVLGINEFDRAIGRVARRVGTADTKVWVEIASGKMAGGTQPVTETSSGT